MAEFKRNKMKQSLWYSPIVLFLFLLVVLIFMYNIVGLIGRAHEASKKKNLVNKEITELENRQNILKKDIENLKTDSGIEETLRDKYQLVNPGENMVIIVDEVEKKPIEEVKKSSSFVDFFKNLFSSKN